jgi:hypothetical protein
VDVTTSQIKSHLPGRLRLRDRRWDPTRLEALEADLLRLDGIIVVETNPRIGSLLVRYDPEILPSATVDVWLTDRLPPEDSSDPAPPSTPLVTSRDANRFAKYGLFASTAVMLLALGTSKRLHAAAGGLNLAFLLVHLLHHRRSLLR